MSHPFIEAREKVDEMRRQANLLEAVDQFAAPEFLLSMAVTELHEYAQEQEKYGTPNYDVVATNGEFDDIAVFFFSWIQTYAANVDMLQTIHSANGYGSHSAALEQLGPVIQDAADDLRAVPEVITRLASIGMHMPVPYVAFEGMDRTVNKVLSNRPPALYSVFCPSKGRELKDEELVRKYQHLEKGTRMIRNKVGRTLQPADWQPYYQQLVGWTQSETNLTVLQHQLAQGMPVTPVQLENAKTKLYTS